MPARFHLRRSGIGRRKHATRIVGHPFVLLGGFLGDHGNRGGRHCKGRRPASRRAGGGSGGVTLTSSVSGRGRSTSRSGRRRSMAASGRSSTACCCCSCTSRSIPATSCPSGSITSVPLVMRRFHRRSPTRTLATTISASQAVRQRIQQRSRRGRRSLPDDQRQIGELGDVLIGNDLAGTIDQHELPLVLPNRERPPFLQVDHNGAGQPPLHRRMLHPGQDSIRARACSSEKPRIGSPLPIPIAARNNGSGVLARPSITTSVTRRPDAAVAVPSRSRRLEILPPEASPALWRARR